jgi:hypothetical protein
MICGLTHPIDGSTGQPSPSHIAVCKQDATKSSIHLPPLPDTPAGNSDPAGQIRLVGITSDGSVLATLALQDGNKGATSSPGYTLWRLPSGGTQWQSLGILPQFDGVYTPGALFASPDSGVIIPPCATCLANESDYVAAYP